jgi:hypothetical protein
MRNSSAGQGMLNFIRGQTLSFLGKSDSAKLGESQPAWDRLQHALGFANERTNGGLSQRRGVRLREVAEQCLLRHS